MNRHPYILIDRSFNNPFDLSLGIKRFNTSLELVMWLPIDFLKSEKYLSENLIILKNESSVVDLTKINSSRDSGSLRARLETLLNEWQ